jgi:hypothetical protein
MRSRIFSLLLLLVTSVMVALPVQQVVAQDPLNDVCGGAGPASESAVCSSRSSVNNPVISIMVNVIQIILLVVGVAAVIVIIVAGFRYVTSSGDPNTVNSAKNTILFAVVGLVVALTGQLIISFVINRL